MNFGREETFPKVLKRCPISVQRNENLVFRETSARRVLTRAPEPFSLNSLKIPMMTSYKSCKCSLMYLTLSRMDFRWIGGIQLGHIDCHPLKKGSEIVTGNLSIPLATRFLTQISEISPASPRRVSLL
jgi:hypothetical protein